MKKEKIDILWKLLDEAMEGRNDVAIDWVSRNDNCRCDAMVHEARKAELMIDEGYKN